MTTLPSLIRWLAAQRMPALRRWASQVLARALLAAALPWVAPAQAADSLTCTGRFPNPITDICWSCILPISIGSATSSMRSRRPSCDTRAGTCWMPRRRVSVPCWSKYTATRQAFIRSR